MKNIRTVLLLLSFMPIIHACEPSKSQEIISYSPDKTSFIKIVGVRTTSLDPFQTSIIINGFSQSDTLMTELYVKEFSPATVQFDWKEASCTVNFIQQDDSKRLMQIKLNENGNSLHELK